MIDNYGIAAIIFLLGASVYDILYHRLGNAPIIIFFLIGMAFRTLTGDAPVTLIVLILIGSLAYYLWQEEVFGGADMKLLIALAPWIPFSGLGNAIGTLFVFTIFFAIIGGLYGIVFIKLFPKSEKVPFIPVILITYCMTWIYRTI
jgi:Flp pilus assembly protein protease CpaA